MLFALGVVWNKKSVSYGPGRKLWHPGDIVQVLLDLDDKSMQFGLNGTYFGIAFVCGFFIFFLSFELSNSERLKAEFNPFVMSLLLLHHVSVSLSLFDCRQWF